MRIARNPGGMRRNWADGERMTEVLTAAQMRAIEQAAIDSGQVTGLELMERAGRGVVEAILDEWPEFATTSHRAVVLCGPGNNGGDGFVVARLLSERGWEVEVFLYGDPEKLPPDARVNYQRLQEENPVARLAFPELNSDDADWLGHTIWGTCGSAVLVDALFGTGLARPIDALGPLLELNDLYAAMPDLAPVRVVSVDLPSGLCADSGRALGESQGLPWAAFQADLTVTFHRARVGHTLAEGPLRCGRLRIADIGLEAFARTGLATHHVLPHCGGAGLVENTIELLDVGWIESQALLSKSTGIHKYHHGHALILSGGVGKGGAARLAARGALRIGAGLVTVGCPPAALQENAARLDAIMLRSIYNSQTEGLRRARPAPQGGRDTAPPLGPGATLAGLLEDTRINALCLGPGLGQDRARALAPAALAAKRATVLDADALTAFADDPAELFSMLHDRCVLTPHGGEFARLFPDIAERLAEPATAGPAYSKVDATRDAAARAGCTVLFKGPDTVIASPGGRAAINSAHYDRAAPWLATAGSGDVLAGFIAGLLARGLHPMQAAETAAWLHVECARAFGPGLIAEDLPEMLPKVFREFGA
jgi:hydroxyethylthiazole kinase-like uncharacterized protein yjeF